MKLFALTDIGLTRKLNEDFFYYSGEGLPLLCVADGVGGQNAGETASLMAVRAVVNVLHDPIAAFGKERMEEAFRLANRCVSEMSQSSAELHDMGTTLSCAWFSNTSVCIGHVGDSRIYLLRNNKLTRVSKDHSFVEELVDAGTITKEQARIHPKRNIITRCIGAEDKIEAQIELLSFEPNDIWLLCSDGLTNYVDDAEIEILLSDTHLSFSEKIIELKEKALSSGGRDNITIVAFMGGHDGK